MVSNYKDTSLRQAQRLSGARFGEMPMNDERMVIAVVIKVVREQKSEGQPRVEFDLMDLDTRTVYPRALALGWSGLAYQATDLPLKPVTKNLNSGRAFSDVYATRIGELQTDLDVNGWDGDIVFAIPHRHRYIILGSLTHPHANEDTAPTRYDDSDDALYTPTDEAIGPQLTALAAEPWPTITRNGWTDAFLQRFGAVIISQFQDDGWVLDVRDIQTSDDDAPKYLDKVRSKIEARRDRLTLRGPEFQLRTGLADAKPAGIHDEYKTLIDCKDSGMRLHASEPAANVDLDVSGTKGLRVQNSGTTGSQSGNDYHGVVKFPGTESILDKTLAALEELQEQYNTLLSDFTILRKSVISMTVAGAVLSNPLQLANSADPTIAAKAGKVSSSLYTTGDVDGIRSTTVTVGNE